MASVTFPDILLREEELAHALPALAHAQGHAEATFTPLAEHEMFDLGDIYDDQIESAVQEIYRRDYLNFGFEGWTGSQAA